MKGAPPAQNVRTSAKRKRRSPDPCVAALRHDMAHGAIDVARGACAACGGALDNGEPVRLAGGVPLHAACAAPPPR